jgi:hypothetical protein
MSVFLFACYSIPSANGICKMNTAKCKAAHLPLCQSIVAWNSSSIEGGPMVDVFHTCDPFDVPDEFLCTWGLAVLTSTG